NLLTHTSGLPAWRPLYLFAENRDAVAATIANEGLEYETGSRVVYSDLGFIALGFLLERIACCRFQELAAREITSPLGLQFTLFNPSAALKESIAASEYGNEYERQMCAKDFAEASPAFCRTGLIWGEVHDGNAHFLGGAGGHAGLFSTASETLRLAD